MPTPGRPAPHAAPPDADDPEGHRRRTDLAWIRTWQRIRAAMNAVDGRLACTVSAGEAPAAVVHEALAAMVAAPRRMLPVPKLAASLGLTTDETTRLVDRLVEAGFACRRRSSADRRVVFAALTDEGVAHERVSTRQYAEQLQIEMSVLGPARLAELQDIASVLSGWTTEDLGADPGPGTPAPSSGGASIEWGAG
ncbi:MarR family transcriptional regulator [Jatrophihabitans sp. YIM 134969]